MPRATEAPPDLVPRSPAGVRAWAVRGLYRAGWRAAGRIPPPLARAAIRLGSTLATLRPGGHLRTLRANLAVATGRDVDHRLLRAAVASYLRTFWEVLALPTWSTAEIRAAVRVEGEDALRAAVAGPGAIVVLPHSANWDLAGAWACLSGYPVTTVAEQLPPAEFADFLAFRTGLGMEVLSHRDPGVLGRLGEALDRGRVVCLIADRDLAGTGLRVDWAGRPVTLPAGPALLARRTGAVLLPGVCHYAGRGMVIRLAGPVPPRPGRDGLLAMTQQVADVFAAGVAEQPEDWHMMQPFFTPHDGSGR